MFLGLRKTLAKSVKISLWIIWQNAPRMKVPLDGWDLLENHAQNGRTTYGVPSDIRSLDCPHWLHIADSYLSTYEDPGKKKTEIRTVHCINAKSGQGGGS